jgi:hypothetical protein
MPAGAGSDAQGASAGGDGHGIPGVETERVGEAELGQLTLGLRRRDDRDATVEALLGDLVEVVAVVVGEEDEVDRREVVDLHRPVGQPGCAHPVAEAHLLVPMDEVRVGEDREPAEPQEQRGVPAERQRVRPFPLAAVSGSSSLWPMPPSLPGSLHGIPHGPLPGRSA